MPDVIPYRSPGRAPPTSLTGILHHLRLREQLRFARITLLFLLGIPLSFVAPAAIAFLVARDSHWLDVFLISTVVVIPLLYWYERRTRGEFAMDALRSWSGGLASASSYGEHEMNRAAGEWILSVEILLFGPRLVMTAAQDLRERARLKQVPLVQVAHTLHRLVQSDHGMEPAALAAATDDIRGTLDAILYLVFHEWIDISKDRRRVWALSHSRKVLGNSK